MKILGRLNLWITIVMAVVTPINLNKSTIAGEVIKGQNDRQCPTNLGELADLLTADISDYGNRVIQKSSIFSHKLDFLPTYIVTASKAELEPLSIDSLQESSLQNTNGNDNIQQIFFTSLERQYSNSKTIVEAENYHWLILTYNNQQWQLVQSFTRFGYPRGDKTVVSPIRDSTNGVIGQAVKIWLKDCYAGSLRNSQS